MDALRYGRAGAGPVPVRNPNGHNISYASELSWFPLRCVAIRVADGHRARPCTSVEGSSSQFLEAFDDVVYVWVVVIVYGILVPS